MKTSRPPLTKLNAVVHIGFVVTGMVTTLLGPVLPALAVRWSLDDAHAGYLFTSEFLGSIAGVALSSFVVPRLGFTRSLACSYLLLALGVAALGVGNAPWQLGLAAAAVYGFGLGITIPATNLWISESSGPRRAAALNVVNLAWGIGAVALPALVALAIRTDALRTLFFLLAGASLVIAVAFFTAPHHDALRPAASVGAGAPARWGLRAALAILFYLYVGAENGVSGWVAMYADRLHVTAGALWAADPSIFWGGLLLGRGIAVPILRRVSEAALLAAGLLLAALGILGLIGAHGIVAVIAGTAIAGLGFSSVFPLLIAKISHHFGDAGTRVAGPLFACAGLGGATLPWLVGFVSQHGEGGAGQAGGAGLRIGLSVPLTAVLLMGFVLMFAGLLREKEREAAPAAATR